MKKVLAILFAVLMTFSVMAISVSAADADVAAIGDATYSTLTEAVAGSAAGDTITLLDDVTEDVTISEDITLDGAGKIYTGKITLSKTGATIQNVRFVDSQIIKGKDSKIGTITVKDCSFEGKIAADQYAINIGFAKKLVVENCTAKNVGFGFIYIPSEVDFVSVKDVDIDGASYGVHVVYNTESVFENVTIKNAYVGFMDQTYGAKTLTFINCNVEADYPVAIWERKATTQTLIFKGGSNDFGTDDYTFGSSYVKAIINVAKIGDVEYGSVQAAVDAAVAGDTVTLIKDVKENATISKDITLDGAGKIYTGKITLSKTGATIQNVKFVDSQIIKGKDSKIGTITVKDCSFEGKIAADQYAINIGFAKKLVVENCTAKNVGFGFIYIPSEVDFVSVKDVDIDGASYGVHVVYNTESVFENVTMKNVYVGAMNQAYGTKTTTFTNCNVDGTFPVVIWARKAITQNYIFEGNNDFVAAEGNTWIDDSGLGAYTAKCTLDTTSNRFGYAHTAEAAVENNVAPDCENNGSYDSVTYCAECGEELSRETITVDALGHTAGAEATCQAAQVCTECGVELDAIKEHKLGEYVSNNDATCKADGTKTAECIYGCGLSDTIKDKGTKKEHVDANQNGDCDYCSGEYCTLCGRLHDDTISDLICLLAEFIRLAISFINAVF